MLHFQAAAAFSSDKVVKPEKKRKAVNQSVKPQYELRWFSWSTVIVDDGFSINLWAAEVCLPARTLRSVFGLSAFLPAAPQVPWVVSLPHHLQLHLQDQQHQASHSLTAPCAGGRAVGGTTRVGHSSSGLLPINREAAASARRRPPPTTPHTRTLHTSTSHTSHYTRHYI